MAESEGAPAATAVLRFVRGADFSGTHFDDENPFPKTIDQLTNARWLRLNNTNLDSIPTAVNRLKKLEHLYVGGNRLLLIPPSICNLTNLCAFRAAHNDLQTEDISGDLFGLKDLSVVDLSHNAMKAFPPNTPRAKGLLALSVSHNAVEEVDVAMCRECSELEYLDLVANQLVILPRQLTNLSHLRTLLLSDNPFDSDDRLQPIFALVSLERLELAATNRTSTNLPDELVNLKHLRDLDLARNPLRSLPPPVLSLFSLERLNLSDCGLQEVPRDIADLGRLQFLNLSRNSLATLPDDICELKSLTRLYLNSNNLTALPPSIGNLCRLEQLLAANNQLAAVPEDLARCSALARLDVHANRLATLPAAVFELPRLKSIDFAKNPGFQRPPRREAGLAPSASLAALSANDPRNGTRSLSHTNLQASKRLSMSSPAKRPEKEHAPGAEQVLKGLVRVAAEAQKQPARMDAQMSDALTAADARPAQPKLRSYQRVDRNLDYSELFPDDLGTSAGLTVFRMENMRPIPIPPAEVGRFYEADTYIVLETAILGGELQHHIYFWIGALSTIDKQGSAAMCAKAMRDHLQVPTATKREEQNSESFEFSQLFDNSYEYISGGTSSGFFDTTRDAGVTRLYVLVDNGNLHAHAVPLSAEWLHDKHVFILENHDIFFLWCGREAPLLVRQKAHLFAERAVQLSPKMTLIEIVPGQEPQRFWDALGGKLSRLGTAFHIPSPRTKLHVMRMGEGFLEMPQVVSVGERLEKRMLDSFGVFILDDYADIWVWIGLRSSRLVRAAAQKMCENLKVMLPRPPCVATFRVTEGNEPQIFRSKFKLWDAPNRKPAAHARHGASAAGAAASAGAGSGAQPPRINVNDMFMPPPIVDERRSDDDEQPQCTVSIVESLRLRPIPAETFGQFYAGDCYLVWVEQPVQPEGKLARGYFWQGRDAPQYMWPFFRTFMHGRTEELKRKLDLRDIVFIHEHQQCESEDFMALFRHRMIIRSGRRCLPQPPAPTLFWTHVCQPALFTRTLQVENNAALLNAHDCFIFVVPFDENNGVLYIWIGASSPADDAFAAQTVARDHLRGRFTEQTVHQGKEPRNFFWAHLDESAAKPNLPGLSAARLFLCSHRQGYFHAWECRPSFSQGHLDDTTTAIVDTGADVFLWQGTRSSPITNRMAVRAATEYIQTLSPERRAHAIQIAQPGEEPTAFTRVFFGWKAWGGIRAKDLLKRASYLGKLRR